MKKLKAQEFKRSTSEVKDENATKQGLTLSCYRLIKVQIHKDKKAKRLEVIL